MLVTSQFGVKVAKKKLIPSANIDELKMIVLGKIDFGARNEDLRWLRKKELCLWKEKV